MSDIQSADTPSATTVYISYNNKDSAEAVRLAEMLRGDDIDLWIFEGGVLGGDDWQQSMREELASRTVFLVLVGPAGIGPWQKTEVNAIVHRLSSEGGVRAIPVLLPGADPESVPIFLKSNTWVDFREGLDDSQAYASLTASIRGLKPSRAPVSQSKTSKKVTRKKQPPTEGSDPEAKGAVPSFRELGPSARAALSRADGIRAASRQDKLHMEYLVYALSMEPNGPAENLLRECGLDLTKLSQLIVDAGGVRITVKQFGETSDLDALPNLSGHVRKAIAAAVAAAKESGAGRVESRHLLYGALAIDECSLIAKLHGAGLRKENIKIAPAGQAEVTIARLNSDDPDGEDLLGIRKEVEALCAVLAASDVTPPLSIGLFGDWGSGKSFFMRKMEQEIEDLKNAARGAEGTPLSAPTSFSSSSTPGITLTPISGPVSPPRFSKVSRGRWPRGRTR